MRNGIILAGIAFAVTLAVIVGNKLSSEALAVAVGALCGIAASIPVSIGLVIAASRNWGHAEERPRQVDYEYPQGSAHRYPQQPPVIVVTPPQMQQSPYGYANQPYYFPPPANGNSYDSREFKVIGDEP